MAPLCGKLLSPADRKVWQQALAMLMGLKIRNGFGEKELAAAVGTALHRRATKRNCEDCGVKVAGGATISLGLAIPNKLPAPNIHRISREARDDI
jgi:hypothetical protein